MGKIPQDDQGNLDDSANQDDEQPLNQGAGAQLDMTIIQPDKDTHVAKNSDDAEGTHDPRSNPNDAESAILLDTRDGNHDDEKEEEIDTKDKVKDQP